MISDEGGRGVSLGPTPPCLLHHHVVGGYVLVKIHNYLLHFPQQE